MKGRRVVGKVECLGSLLTVIETDKENELKDDKGTCLNGFYQADHNLIVIDSRLPIDVKNEVLEHELGHATFEQSLFADRLVGICDPEDAEKLEEDIMRCFLPAYMSTIRNNKLRFK